MLKIIIAIVVVILLTILIVRLIDKFLPKKLKPLILLILWAVIIFLGYLTYNSVSAELKFNKVKQKRYAEVIKTMIDIRDAQVAHNTVTGKYQGNWDNLVAFIDTAHYTITQRRDTSVIDVEATRRFGGVQTFKDEVVVDTLGTVSVKDSLFGADPRYKNMMFIPTAEEGAKFELKDSILEQGGYIIPVFEIRAQKSKILFDQDPDLIKIENQAQSVDAVNGDAIIVGSLEEVNTNGNWPKSYSTKQ